VGWRAGLPYDYVRLLSWRDIRTLARDHGLRQLEVEPASVSEAELLRFNPRRRGLATLYNRLLRRASFRMLAREIGPFFHIHARKPGPGNGG
jgi:hypothetical protein